MSDQQDQPYDWQDLAERAMLVLAYYQVNNGETAEDARVVMNDTTHAALDHRDLGFILIGLYNGCLSSAMAAYQALKEAKSIPGVT